MPYVHEYSNVSRFVDLLKTFFFRLWIGHGNGHRYYHCVDAHYGYDMIPDSVKNACSTFNAVGVWCSKEDIHVYAPSNRVFTYTSHGANTVYVFG